MKRMTVDEVDRLYQAAANGDKVAIQRIDKFWRDQWRDYPEIAAEQDWPKSFADEVEKVKKKMAQLKTIDDDPVNRMIRTRIRQDVVQNDPVLSAILDMDAREFRQAVYRRMGQPIALPPQTSAGNGPQMISITDGRIAEIRSMFRGGNLPSDKEIATKLIISESLAKQLRLKAGIKRRERKKSMS